MTEIALFNKTAFLCSKVITEKYSSSFTLGVKLLDDKFQLPVYGLYAFLRYADEIVDTFLESDRKKILDKFKSDTYEAIDSKISFNPVLHALQLVVNEYNIEKELLDAFFVSMEMDLYFTNYDRSRYEEYVYGCAEVVALMCLRVISEGDDDMYRRLKEPARKIFSAYQKINFLRDFHNDYEKLGRLYFPGMEYTNFDEAAKVEIEEDIQADLDIASLGVDQLPDGVRSGVQIPYLLFSKLFEKIKELSAEELKKNNVKISKLILFTTEAFFYFWLNILIISIPLLTSFESRVNYVSKWKSLFPAIILSASFFLAWNIKFTRDKILRFNPRYFIGIKKFGIPIEEWMFFFTVPYSCVFIHESLKYFFPQDIFYLSAKPIFYLLILFIVTIGLYHYNKLYTRISAFVAVGTILVHYCIFNDKLLGRFLLSLIVHYIPFFICNGLLTGGFGMKEPVVIYNKSELMNFRFGTIPVEDFVFSMSLLLMNITIFETFQDFYI